MVSPNDIGALYRALSSLYKNPTNVLKGIAAINVDDEMLKDQQRLMLLFRNHREHLKKVDPSLYYRVATLLYEIDDYRGARTKQVINWIGIEANEFSVEITRVNNHSNRFHGPRLLRGEEGDGCFTNAYNRSYWKARVICSVAAVESRRRGTYPNSRNDRSLTQLTEDLDKLERFVLQNLHLPAKNLSAWTTLAVIRSAQARIARQDQEYHLAEQKLLESIECLAERADEIREKTRRIKSPYSQTPSLETSLNELRDDMVSIQRKQTLLSFFNLALVALQRGFLRTANRACQSARLQFRFHGHNYHALFNELIILSIKRARTSRENSGKFRELRSSLRKNIIRNVKPATDPSGKGNRKLYLYALRELALIHSLLGQTKAMLKVLNLMEQHASHLGDQWKARIEQQRARAFWLLGNKSGDSSFHERALSHSLAALKAATGKEIGDYNNSGKLVSVIKKSKSTNRIDTIESLITHGSILITAKKSNEAIRISEAVIEYCDEENPRLLAMGHLVRAEAYFEVGRMIEARGDLSVARVLLRRIDHRYVADRMLAIERRWLKETDYLPLEDLRRDEAIMKKASHRLIGLLIDNYTDKKSPSEIARRLIMQPRTVVKYLQEVDRDEQHPYHHLGAILLKTKKSREGAKRAREKKAATDGTKVKLSAHVSPNKPKKLKARKADKTITKTRKKRTL